jgi:hypothetical protein
MELWKQSDKFIGFAALTQKQSDIPRLQDPQIAMSGIPSVKEHGRSAGTC